MGRAGSERTGCRVTNCHCGQGRGTDWPVQSVIVARKQAFSGQFPVNGHYLAPAGAVGGWVAYPTESVGVQPGGVSIAIGIAVRTLPPICLVLLLCLLAGCASREKKVEDAKKAARSWAATVKAVTEQWAQSRVSLRFTRTTLNTATQNLYREAESIRSVDGTAARRIDRLKDAIDPVMDAVALNEPDRARDLATRLPVLAGEETTE